MYIKGVVNPSPLFFMKNITNKIFAAVLVFMVAILILSTLKTAFASEPLEPRAQRAVTERKELLPLIEQTDQKLSTIKADLKYYQDIRDRYQRDFDNYSRDLSEWGYDTDWTTLDVSPKA